MQIDHNKNTIKRIKFENCVCVCVCVFGKSDPLS